MHVSLSEYMVRYLRGDIDIDLKYFAGWSGGGGFFL